MVIDTRQKQALRRVAPEASDTVNIEEFARYLHQQWRLLLIASFTALALTAIGSFLTPAKYTATASILIEPPAGNDPRGATALSPVYLESLKTYEHFASTDTLFRRALTELGLRKAYSGTPIENLKHRVLKVRKLKDEKILEISATLSDRRKSQQLAQYIAEQTVARNRSLENDSMSELLRDATNELQSAEARLRNARASREAYVTEQPIAAVDAELAGATDLKARVDRNLADAEVELAAALARMESQRSDKVGANAYVTKDDLVAIQAQVASLRQQSQRLAPLVANYSAIIEKRKQKREMLDKEVQFAQAQYETAVTRRAELLSSEAFRGERLEIIDPSVVPERPSSPNIPLNLIVAVIASLFCCTLYLAFRFGYMRTQTGFR